MSMPDVGVGHRLVPRVTRCVRAAVHRGLAFSEVGDDLDERGGRSARR